MALWRHLWIAGARLSTQQEPTVCQTGFVDRSFPTDRLLLNDCLTRQPPPIDAQQPDWSARLFASLAQDGRAVVAAPVANADLLRRVFAECCDNAGPVGVILNIFGRLAYQIDATIWFESEPEPPERLDDLRTAYL